MSDYEMEVEKSLDVLNPSSRFDDVDEFESYMSPGDINNYLSDQITGEDEEATLDLDKVREIFEFACGEEFSTREWGMLIETPEFDEFWDALEVVIRSYMRSEGLIY